MGQGFSVGIYRVDYRGFTNVPASNKNNYAKFYAEYFFAGIKGPTTSKNFQVVLLLISLFQTILLLVQLFFLPVVALQFFVSTLLLLRRRKERNRMMFLLALIPLIQL